MVHNGPMTDRPESAELLEARHDFPCPYTFKVIGEAGDGLEQRVAECVSRELRLDAPPETSVKTASGGRHESITVEPVCPDADSVLDLYERLRGLRGVLFLF